MSLKKLTLSFILCAASTAALAQNPTSAPNTGVARVTGVNLEYTRYYNDNQSNKTVKLCANKEWGNVFTDDNETIYLNFQNDEFFAVAKLCNGETIATEAQPLDASKLTLKEQNTQKIRVWECNIYKLTQGNEDIEIWSSPNLGYAGTPCPEYGCPEGELVLRVIKDGEIILNATKIDRSINIQDFSPKEEANRTLTPADYRHARIYSL